MPLPPEIDQKFQDRFAQMLNHAVSLSKSDSGYYQVKTELFSLMHFISPSSTHFQQLREEINRRNSNADAFLLGYAKGLKADYEAGMFDSLPDVASHYMSQAEKLLGEGVPGRNDHVPAAVLAGAVLENALRRLCLRQTAPIDTLKPDGGYKTLDPLIADLQKANVFKKAKADMLRSLAKIRNYAAHGSLRNSIAVMWKS